MVTRRKSVAARSTSSPVTVIHTTTFTMAQEQEQQQQQHEHQDCCPICYEEFDKDDIETGVVVVASRVKLELCGHCFCRDCLKQHCEQHLNEHYDKKQVPMIPCPSPLCDEHMVERQLQQDVLLDDTTLWTKYQRHLQLANDPSLVPCTRCDALVSKAPQEDDDDDETDHNNNNLTCTSCGHTFCTIHGDAHLGLTCQEYESRPPSRQDLLSQTAIADTTKPCPHCGSRIELYGGCEHIVCTSCNNDWCYKCGQSQYLVGNTIRTCTLCQQSYMDHRKLERQRIMACLTLPFTLPMAILYMVVATASAMASGCCCLFFGCGVFVGDDDELRPPSPKRGIRMTLIYLIWPLLDILTDFGVPVYSGWLVKGIEQELGLTGNSGSSNIASAMTDAIMDEESTLAASDDDYEDDLSL